MFVTALLMSLAILWSTLRVPVKDMTPVYMWAPVCFAVITGLTAIWEAITFDHGLAATFLFKTNSTMLNWLSAGFYIQVLSTVIAQVKMYMRKKDAEISKK